MIETKHNQQSNDEKNRKKLLVVAFMHHKCNDRSIFRRPPLLPAKKMEMYVNVFLFHDHCVNLITSLYMCVHLICECSNIFVPHG